MENKRTKRYIAAGVAVLLLLILAVAVAVNGSRKNNTENEAQEGGADFSDSESVVMTAMYIPITEEIFLLIGQEDNNGTVFTATLPEELYDVEGNRITRDRLERGNILRIYGNGIMLESYPGQYPGVDRIEVAEEGNPSDADRYQDIVDEFYQEPDPAEPPTLNGEYTTELAAVVTMISRGGYEWTWLDRDGTTGSVVADSSHVLMWDEELLNPVRLKEAVDMTLSFSEEPEEVTVVRWPADLRDTEDSARVQDSISKGEAVKVETEEGKFFIPGVEAGYVYLVTGIWENGRAEYGFLTTE